MNTGVNRKYCSGGKMKYDKGGFWSAVGDYGKFLADVPLSMVGAKDVVGKDDYNTQFFKSVNDVTGTVMPIAGQVAANIVAPGIGGAMMSGVQSVGSALNPMEEQPNRPDMLRATNAALTPSTVNTPTYVLEKGGNLVNNNQMLNTFKGPSHEEGGIAIGQNNEVEGGETSLKDYIFSDTTKVPGTKVTFAQMSKRIESKYGRRKNDAMSDKAKERELQALKEIQEEVRFKEDAAAMANLADTNPQLFQQMTGSPANPAVAELMPGQQQQMVDVPMQQLKKGGKLLKNKSTILGTQSPGVTMEVIRSGRHYIDTLVAVTHNRRRRYAKGGTIPDNGERLAYRQNPDSSTAERLEMDENGNIIRPIPTFKPATNTYIDRRNNTAPLLPSMIDTEEGRRRILLSQGIDPDTGQRIEKDKAPLLEDDSTKQYALEQALKLQLEQQQQLQGLTKRYAKGGSIYIKPSKKGTFTAAATKHGESVQEFASQVLANKEDYSPAMVKKANFARNASKFKHFDGGGIVGENPIDWRKYYYATNNDVKGFDYNDMQQYEYWNRVKQSDIAEGRYREPSSFIEQMPQQQNQQTYTTLPSGVPMADPYMGQKVNKHKFTARFTEQPIIQGTTPVQTINPIFSSGQPVTEGTPPRITDNLYSPNGASITNDAVQDVAMNRMQPKIAGQIPTPNPFPEQIATRDIPAIDGTAPKSTVAGNESSITPGAMIGMGIQGAGLLAKGILLGKRNKYMPAEYTPVAPVSFERVNAREPLAQSKSAFAGANTALARNAGSTGQYLSNRIASGVGEGMQRAGIVEQVNNQNAQIQAQEATQNAQIALQNAQRKLQVGEINQQEYDSVTQAWNDYMNDVVGVGAGVTKDVLGYGAQDIALQNLDTANFDYQLINGKWTPIPKQNFGTGLKMDITTTPQTEIKRDGSVATVTTKRKGGYLKNKNKQFIY